MAKNEEVTGEISGLKQSQLKALTRTFQRRSSSQELMSIELARHLALVSRDIGRQVGVLVDRRGQVQHVFVGDARRIYLPDLGRARAGAQQRRGLRHVHTTLQGGGLEREDLTDLIKLRLDAVAAVAVDAGGLPGKVHYALLRRSPNEAPVADQHEAPSPHHLPDDFAAALAALEAEERRGAIAGAGHAAQGTRAMLVGVYQNRHGADVRQAELVELAETAGVQVVDQAVQMRRSVEPKFVLGRGKLEEIVLDCLDQNIELLVFDHALTPTQARSIAATTDLKVIDRTQLILDIFAQHAHTRDGKLQVELAQLRYNLPRLTDLDAGLSRLTGGIGGRGPGETKLEINRRRARARLTRLEHDLKALGEGRALRRSRREQGDVPIVSIVGYTNAGKSTLMRKLSGAEVFVADMLFATLDAKSRRVHLEGHGPIILTDTVGFIRDLPKDLITAFRATLEELAAASVLLHVVDAADDDCADKIASVQGVLKDLDLEPLPTLFVFNKTDAADPLVVRGLLDRHDGVAVSAATGAGFAELKAHIAELALPASADAQQMHGHEQGGVDGAGDGDSDADADSVVELNRGESDKA